MHSNSSSSENKVEKSEQNWKRQMVMTLLIEVEWRVVEAWGTSWFFADIFKYKYDNILTYFLSLNSLNPQTLRSTLLCK